MPCWLALQNGDITTCKLLAVKVKAGDDPVARFAPYFQSLEPVAVVPITREGRVAMRVALFRGVNFVKLFPTVQPR